MYTVPCRLDPAALQHRLESRRKHLAVATGAAARGLLRRRGPGAEAAHASGKVGSAHEELQVEPAWARHGGVERGEAVRRDEKGDLVVCDGCGWLGGR